jgi:hypothetical protein
VVVMLLLSMALIFASIVVRSFRFEVKGVTRLLVGGDMANRHYSTWSLVSVSTLNPKP